MHRITIIAGEVSYVKCVLMLEYSNPKDEARWKQLLAQSKDVEKLMARMVKDGVISSEMGQWADNTGRQIFWMPFENMEKFAKFYADEEFQKGMAKATSLIDDIQIRLLRPSISVDD
jgi:hypothetical protein